MHIITQEQRNMTTLPDTLPPDPLAQAGELLRRYAAGEPITGGGHQLDAATVAASVAYAQAVELRRVGDMLARLIDVQRAGSRP